MALFRRKLAQPQPTDHYDAALNWESSRIYQVQRSNRTAWRVTGVACCLTLISWATIMVMMPLKQRVPYLIRENTTTGAVDVLDTLSAPAETTFQDTRDKYWLAQYVTHRETYDWYTLQTDYNFVGATSMPNVAAEYGQLFIGDKALDKTFQDKVKATITINSVVPNGNWTGTVRFTKETKRVDDPGHGAVTHWVATVGYAYQNPSTMKESLRLINPFAFQVTTYRVDPELSSSAQN
ncbi:virB8 family protein [Methylovirgula sp. 4M-Z18]|uniref:virB8 family protein n=1 Tax=Methylovirgula sp. 4M-Z18 TaxID=2293567 RepID=UPI000E2EBD28|nr:VirB8/TrbF family protein [Methylovirgula sp. 4M-Z18]RFB76673.1 virB8 family protein [Methylovirgula sp. 4M-Z18]